MAPSAILIGSLLLTLARNSSVCFICVHMDKLVGIIYICEYGQIHWEHRDPYPFLMFAFTLCHHLIGRRAQKEREDRVLFFLS